MTDTRPPKKAHKINVLPEKANLSKLKKQAKKLLREYREGVPQALDFVQAFHPKPGQFKSLRDAQLSLARCYGYSGWMDLSDAVELSMLQTLNLAELAEQFIELACVRYDGNDSQRHYTKANRLLEETPKLATHNFICAIVSHNVTTVKNSLQQNPGLALQSFPPRHWQPLLYLTYSRIQDQSGEAKAVQIAQLLLEFGADPDSHFIANDTYRFTALTGAMGEGETGIQHQPPHQYAKQLADVLLKAGANPNDSQGLYNTMFSDNGDYWLDCLHSHGLTGEHRANWDHSENPIKMFNYLLESCVMFDRVDRAKKLLQLGADPNAQCHYSQRSIYTLSLVKGRKTITEALLAAGAKQQSLSIEDQFLIAILEQDIRALEQLLSDHASLLTQPALFENVTPEILQVFVDNGFDVNQRDTSGNTALHIMAKSGKLDCVKYLLQHGADPTLRETHYQGNAVGHAHFNRQWRVRDYLLSQFDFVLEACACGHYNRLKEILRDKPSLVHSRGLGGNTVLHVVCNWLHPGEQDDHREDIYRLLIEKGAKIEITNDEGQNALQFNERINSDENVAILKQYNSNYG